MSAFDQAWAWLVGNEGGYSNNPADPGGETMWGVTKRVAVANGYTGDMRSMPQDTAKGITKKVYWDAYQLDRFPLEIGFQVLDAAYNGGHPAQWLQAAAGVLPDGKIGDQTVAAVLAADPDKIVMRFDAARLKYMASLAIWPSFGKGWANRIADNLLRAAA